MPHPNEQLLRRFYEHFTAGDLDTMARSFDDDVVFHEPGRHPLAGTHRGASAILDFFRRIVEKTEGTLELTEVSPIVANDDSGAARLRLTARTTAGPIEVEAVELYTFRAGRISEIRAYLHDQYAWDQLLS
ncbi:nuclear transport factor 2 family protein [Lipingzhangella sp. LS1_29]|uniref:Nuclear transport factor 2 family protein n=1 Tax=Lipingzhangella rawalii TaxID=2055835 RepID=A0ABU2HAF8_9ACTN|nr:nuclear transport factor 2 family protein [Lipingzhangella rawalii]MDS1272305.1 nuclear transport factor 2 family protein [Lipingzhangella rawalii]